MAQYTTAPILALRYNTLNLSTSSVDVHYCHIASPTDTTQSTSVPVPVYWYGTVHQFTNQS